VAKCSGQKIEVRSTQTGKKIRTIKIARSSYPYFDIAFSPDGRRLAMSSLDLTINLWDLQTGEEVFALCGHTAPVVTVAFSADGHRLISSSLDETIKIWDATPVTDEFILSRTAAAEASKPAPLGWFVVSRAPHRENS
jgi:WD40 repeat protein